MGRVHSSPGPADGEGKGWGSLVGTRTGGLCEPHPSQRSALESLAGLRSGSEGAVVTVARSKGAGRQSNLCPNDQSLLGRRIEQRLRSTRIPLLHIISWPVSDDSPSEFHQMHQNGNLKGMSTLLLAAGQQGKFMKTQFCSCGGAVFTDCFCSCSQHTNFFTDNSGENRQVQLHWSSKRSRAKFH